MAAERQRGAVMDALRNCGIEELRERIPVKIELVQEQRSSGSTVRVLPESQS